MDTVHAAVLALALPLAGCAYGPGEIVEATGSTSSAVSTADRRHLRASITGLLGGGLVLADDGAGTLSASGEGVVVFPNTLAAGASYALTITDQPVGPRQSCTLLGAVGTVGDEDPVVQVTCAAPTFTVGGHVTGVGAVGLVLQENGNESIALSSDGSFRFTTALVAGTGYAVAISQQPEGQTCQVYFADGIVVADDVDTVEVVCDETKRPLAGLVRGLEGNVLLANGDDVLSVHGSGRFTMPTPVAIGAAYALTVAEQPPGQTCTITAGAGTMSAAPADVVVECTTTLGTLPTVTAVASE